MKEDELQMRLERIRASQSPNATRVVARTLAGTSCILPGLNRFDGDMTMTARFPIEDMLGGRAWIRLATEEETRESGNWWHPLQFVPRSIIHSNGIVAGYGDTLGMYGVEVTVLQQAREEEFTTVDEMDWEDVSTPPTPPPF